MTKINLADSTKIMLDELIASDSYDTPCVMTLPREKKLDSEDVPEKLLSLTDKLGTSVPDVCIERFKEPIINNRGRTVPRTFLLVCKPDCGLLLHFRKVQEI